MRGPTLTSVSKELKHSIEFERSNASMLCALVSQNCKLIELNKEHILTIKQKDKQIEELTNTLLTLLSK
jgi:hypothetical protein